jgi:hypothetical protein
MAWMQKKKRESNLEYAIDAQGASTYIAQRLYKERSRSERRSGNGKGEARLLRDLPGAHARTKEFPARGAKHRAWNIRCE